jgi:tight adherence protein B
MDLTQMAVIMGGVFAILVLLIFAFSGPSTGKAQSRRIDVIRERHQPGAAIAIETQLRKLSSRKATRMDGIAQKLIPNPAMLRTRLDRTDKGWKLGQYSGICAGITVAVSAAAIMLGLPILLALLMGVAIGMGFPHMFVGMVIGKRIKQFNAKFPDAIDLMVRGLRSGLPISETLGIVGTEIGGPIGVEFRNCVDKIRIGRTMDAALQETADRINTPEIQFFCITLAIQRETGGNLAETLSNLSEVLRKRAQMKLKIAAMSSESKASAYIIGALPFIVFILIYTISPSYMGQFFHDQRLMMIGFGGLCWMGIGAGVMAKMISFEI